MHSFSRSPVTVSGLTLYLGLVAGAYVLVLGAVLLGAAGG